ncbi:MAG TPA: flagellar hook capping FlgD N-terminal domain-containing protein [Verrucomicrobiae bacterium]|nr:flagellar hook capping FlgD N-terminal domain-containing protein [Verrucomicrobiae bacterium]
MSTVSSVSTTSTNPYSTTDSASNPSQTLNQNDFLKLLVSQIQYQDPMNPKSDTDMAAQMAQFTSLQQASQSTSSLAMMQANSLVGTTVGITIDSTHATSGVVQGVTINSGIPQIMVGGNAYSLSQVTAVAPTPVTAPTGTSSDSSQKN